MVHNFRQEKPDDLWLFSRSVDIEEGKHSISVGYYIEDGKTVNTKKRPKVFCFFPTIESFNFCFIMHAPFSLVDNRQLIKREDAATNSDIFKKLAQLAADALVCLCEIGQGKNKFWIQENIFEIVPLEQDYSSDKVYREWYNYFHSSFCNTLEKEKVHYSTDKKYVSADKSVKLDNALLKLLTTKQYTQLTGDQGCHFVYPRLSTNRIEISSYLDDIGIEEFDIDRFGVSFSESFISRQDDEWILKFYKFLISDEARRLIEIYQLNRGTQSKAHLLHKPFLRTSGKKFVAPYTVDNQPNVFVGDGTIKVPGMNFIDPVLYASNDTKKLMEKLKLGAADKINIVVSSILPKYYKSMRPDENQYIADFQYILDVYLNASAKDATELVRVCREKLSFKATDGYFYNIENVIYDGLEEFRAIQDDIKELHVLDVLFYRNISKKRENEIISFLGRFPFEKYLYIYRFEINSFNRESLYRRKGPIGAVKKEIDSSVNRYNPTHFYDYRMHTFNDSCSNGRVSFDYSYLVWKSVSYYLRKTNKEILLGKCEYFYYSEKKTYFESELLESLHNNKWLYNKQGQLCKPKDVTVEDLDERYDKSDEMFEVLGLRHSAKIADDQLIKQCSRDTQDTYEMGKVFTDRGMSLEDAKKAAEMYAREMERMQRQNIVENDHDEIEEEGDLSFTDLGRTAETKELDERYASGKEKSNASSSLKKPAKKKDRSAGLEEFLERQQRHMETECEKEDLLQKMAELPVYTKDWFLCGLRYEYLNSEDTGRDQISRSVSLSFTKVLPEHSNVYRFCNASKPIPRWIEEIDGDIKVVLHFQSGDEVTINFAMACVQDFSLRLRAKAGDEKSLSEINWSDLTTANLDINNPKGLVKNLYDAFFQLPFEGDYDFQKNLSSNVEFIFGPPGTGKTTNITEWISGLMKATTKCRILVLAPTNQACDVITRQLMDQNQDSYGDWLGRFVATNDEIVDQSAVVCERDSDFYKRDVCCIVSTMARLSYDFFENASDGKVCLKDIRWDYVVCDEGSMISLPEIIYAIYKFSYDEDASFIPTPIIVAGDPKQLQPIDSCNVWGKRSIYDVVELDDFVNPKTYPIQFKITNLETQHRSVPAIGELFSRYSYGGKLQHSRKDTEAIELNIKGLKLSPITYMPFEVDNFDDIYGAKRMAGSNVHIYSAILTAELCKYIATEYVQSKPEKKIKIGIISPYIAQVQLVDKLISSICGFSYSDMVDITSGTIHSFQGDQCDIVFVLFNPPKGMASKRQDAFTILLNDDHLVNVAISRARDYLCIMVPTYNSVGSENLTDINRVAKILVSKEYSRKQDVGQIDCEQIERLLFGQKGYLKKKSYITSHQMANVYTPTGYRYDIRVDDSVIDIQITPEASTLPAVATNNSPVAAGEILPTAAESASSNSEQESAQLPLEREKLIVSSTVVSEQIMQAVKSRDEAALERILLECSGRNISLYRSAVKDVVASNLVGEDFWWFFKVVLKVNPSVFRLPIIEALTTSKSIDKLVVPDIKKYLTDVVALLFKDPDKVSQDIDVLHIFKSYYNEKMPNEIKRFGDKINQPETIIKLFELYHIKGENKINLLLDIRSEAALYMICKWFADKNCWNKLPQEEFNIYRHIEYRKSIYDKLQGGSELEKLARRIILSTIQHVSQKEQDFVDVIFVGGFDQFQTYLASVTGKQKHRDVISNLDEEIGRSCSAVVILESVNHYLVNIRGKSVSGLLPKKLAFSNDLKPGDQITVRIAEVFKKQKLVFVSQKDCGTKEIYETPLANIGDKVVLEYYNEGKCCQVRSGCLKQIRPIVLGQKEHFDYKAKYAATIVGRRSFFDYEMQLENSDNGSKKEQYRLSKVAKELNVGIAALVSCLRRNGYSVTNNPNEKINAVQYQILKKEFGKK